MKQAVVMGSVMASFTCEAFGTDGLKALTVSDMETRMKAYKEMTACGPIVWPEQG